MECVYSKQDLTKVVVCRIIEFEKGVYVGEEAADLSHLAFLFFLLYSPGTDFDGSSEAIGAGEQLVPYRAKFIAAGAVRLGILRSIHPP